jgi:hypothetical protein
MTLQPLLVHPAAAAAAAATGLLQLLGACSSIQRCQLLLHFQDDQRTVSGLLSNVTQHLTQGNPGTNIALAAEVEVSAAAAAAAAGVTVFFFFFIFVCVFVFSLFLFLSQQPSPSSFSRRRRHWCRCCCVCVVAVAVAAAVWSAAWWAQAIRDAPKVTEALQRFAEKYDGMAAWSAFENDINSKLTAALVEFRAKQCARDLEVSVLRLLPPRLPRPCVRALLLRVATCLLLLLWLLLLLLLFLLLMAAGCWLLAAAVTVVRLP